MNQEVLEIDMPVPTETNIVEEEMPVTRSFNLKDISTDIMHGIVWTDNYNGIIDSIKPSTSSFNGFLINSAMPMFYANLQDRATGVKYHIIELPDEAMNELKVLCVAGNKLAVQEFISQNADVNKINVFKANDSYAIVKIMPNDGIYTMGIFGGENGPEEYCLIVDDEHIANLHKTAEFIREYFAVTQEVVTYQGHSIISEGIKIPVKLLIQDINIAAKACYSATHQEASSMNLDDLMVLLKQDVELSFSIDDVHLDLLCVGDIFESQA